MEAFTDPGGDEAVANALLNAGKHEQSAWERCEE